MPLLISRCFCYKDNTVSIAWSPIIEETLHNGFEKVVDFSEGAGLHQSMILINISDYVR